MKLADLIKFVELIRGYEARSDAEAKFVYALDKVMPVMNIYLDGGRSWETDGVTLKMLVEGKQDKVAFSKEIQDFFEELLALLKREEAQLFHYE